MRVLHICVCGPFTDGFAYQENELIEQHVVAGHAVTVIASTETYGTDKVATHTEPGVSQLRCGATLIRIPYVEKIPLWLASKVRAYDGLSDRIEAIKPDRILFHGLTAWELLRVAKYVQRTPGVKLFADCHEDFNNSAKTWASRQLLHKGFYRAIFRQCLQQIEAVLCVTVESMNFAVDFYGSPRAKTRLFPLGCVIDPPTLASTRRSAFRARHGLVDTDIVVAQTGKLDRSKHLVSALRAFSSVSSPDLKFVIAGRMTDDVATECLPLIDGDSRIINLGWQSTDELRTVLAGVDCFLQPFGQTVTTQMAMGYGCVILGQDLPSHRWLVGDHGRLFTDSTELGAVFQWIVDNTEKLPSLKNATLEFAYANLDYTRLARQIVS